MNQQNTIKAFRAELRARFGKDWKARPFWLTTDREPQFSLNGISLYIWRDRIASAPEDPEAEEE
jgi:hypothetical protein